MAASPEEIARKRRIVDGMLVGLFMAKLGYVIECPAFA
jgi:hypothetical protein